MASITIRNLDEATKQALRERAARNGRSMEEEVRHLLRDATVATGAGPVVAPAVPAGSGRTSARFRAGYGRAYQAILFWRNARRISWPG